MGGTQRRTEGCDVSVSPRQRELLTELGHPPDYEPDQGTVETEFLFSVYVALRQVQDLAERSATEAREKADEVRTRYEALFAAARDSAPAVDDEEAK